METGHDHGVAEIKHLRGHKRRRRGAAASLFLQIQRGDTVGFGERMVVRGSQHGEFIRDVWCPGRGVVIGYADFERLPGCNDGLLLFVLGFKRQTPARILAVGHAGARRGGLL